MKSYAHCITLLAGLIAAPAALADVTPVNYRVGATVFNDDGERILVHSTPPVTIAILPGGATWPRLSLYDTGHIYAGNIVIDAATKRIVMRAGSTLALPYGVTIKETRRGFQFARAGTTCRLSLRQLGLSQQRTARDSLKHSNIQFASSPTGLTALAMQFGPDGDMANYLVQQVDIQRCRVASRKRLGNPDLLVELNYSRQGGWWITGSIEQTLLQSSDGLHWRAAALPEGLSSLISSYVANPREIWLAGILLTDDEPSPYLLVYSGDGGRTWRNLVAGDALLDRVPPGWLEGQRRRVPQ